MADEHALETGVLEDGGDFALEDGACHCPGLRLYVHTLVVELYAAQACDVVAAVVVDDGVGTGHGDGQDAFVALEVAGQLAVALV